MSSIYDFTALSLQGAEVPLAEFKGKAMMIVNTASKCGFTPQYSGLEALYEKYRDKGFTILGFPCNQFGAQEPGGENEIGKFCAANYGVTFPMFAKIDVNGRQAHPLYQFLKTEKRGILGTANIKWNFTKFLVDREGKVRGRYAPITPPENLDAEISSLL